MLCCAIDVVIVLNGCLTAETRLCRSAATLTTPRVHSAAGFSGWDDDVALDKDAADVAAAAAAAAACALAASAAATAVKALVVGVADAVGPCIALMRSRKATFTLDTAANASSGAAGDVAVALVA